MNLAEQLEKLQALRERGALSEEEFVLAKKRVIETPEANAPDANTESRTRPLQTPPSALQSLRRSTSDRWIGGICGGLGEMTSMPSWSWRILFILGLLLHGIGLVVYVLMWIFVPLQSTSQPVHRGFRGEIHPRVGQPRHQLLR